MGERKRIAVFGLGSMGYGMAASLLRAGHETYGFDAVAATQELRAYDSLLSSLPVSKRQKIVVPLAIGLTSLTLAGILLTVPTGNNSIVFAINASAVGMTLDSPVTVTM